MNWKAASLGLFAAAVTSMTNAETISIGIGHQSMVTNTVSGGVILEKLSLIEKYLPKDGKYADVEYEIVFKDYSSGPPITNQMLAGKLEFGVMGDYPLIVNGASFQQTGKMNSRFIAVTGYNLKGTGNGIVVPIDSPINSLEELAGKSISTPVGSAAWGMTLKALRDLQLDGKVTIKSQSPSVGAANIAAKKIDAHADFCPWSEIMEYRGTGRKIFDGSEAGVPTFHGIVVRQDFADKYPEVVQAVVNATLEAQRWIQKDPVRAAVKLSEWTGVEKEVLYLYFSEGGITTVDASIKKGWVEAMKYDHALLKKEKNIPDLDFDRWVDSQFVEAAYRQIGVNYDKKLAEIVTPVPGNPNLAPAEIWFEQKGIVKYDSIKSMVVAYKKARESGVEVSATYVYDKNTGLKLFGKVAFLVTDKSGEQFAFMKRNDAEKYVAKNGGTVTSLAGLVSGTSSLAAAD